MNVVFLFRFSNCTGNSFPCILDVTDHFPVSLLFSFSVFLGIKRAELFMREDKRLHKGG